ncbi:hypothetical protein PTTG_28112 [Puccinia triticina 1-1 BBBD Race 1]|uniref:Uncharacterized protein n=1 Tax=Puccinia triticina (isolate 1-1 / race 1 (BBBD)) TaxID=630390 RepID=A0A180GEB0_PUCT1|nr:hypothetical protein PTTG_28112 [Puccinia triticina 1-1 BBBD Race 1]
MSDLNIQDTSNSAKAAAQNPHPQGELNQPAHQNPPPEPGANAGTPSSSSQVPGPQPKPTKAAKAPKATKPVTRAATKNTPTGQLLEQEIEEPLRETLKDPDIAEIIANPSVPKPPEIAVSVNDPSSEEEKDRETRAFLMARLIRAEKAGD